VCKSQIEVLASLVHPRDGHPKILAMMHAYLDESGIHDGAALCVIAGFFGGPGQWRKFEPLWKRALADFDVECFHSEEFRAKDTKGNRIGPYVGWTAERDQAFLDRLVSAVVRYKIHPIASGIIVTDFRAYSLDERRYLTGAEIRRGKFRTSGCPSKPYFLPFQSCLQRICDHAGVSAKAHFFFGSDRTFSEYALSLFKHLQKIAKPELRIKLGTIAFPLAKDTPALQAADLLSYTMYQEGLERLKMNSWNTSPGPLLRALMQRRIVAEDTAYMDRENMDTMLSFVTVPPPIKKK